MGMLSFTLRGRIRRGCFAWSNGSISSGTRRRRRRIGRRTSRVRLRKRRRIGRGCWFCGRTRRTTGQRGGCRLRPWWSFVWVRHRRRHRRRHLARPGPGPRSVVRGRVECNVYILVSLDGRSGRLAPDWSVGFSDGTASRLPWKCRARHADGAPGHAMGLLSLAGLSATCTFWLVSTAPPAATPPLGLWRFPTE